MRNSTLTRLLLLFVLVLIGIFAYKSFSSQKKVAVSSSIVSKAELQTEDVEVIIRDYIMSNPEIIVSSVENLQKRKIGEMQQQVTDYIQNQKNNIETDDNPPVVGSNNSNVNITFFYDYNCSYCREGWKTLHNLIQEDKKIKIILRPIPILGEVSEYAAKLLLVVQKISPEKLFSVHEDLMSNGRLTILLINQIGQKNGIDLSNIDKLFDKIQVNNLLSKNIELSKNLKIQGTPAYIIDNQMFSGLLDLDKLKQLIEEERGNTKVQN